MYYQYMIDAQHKNICHAKQSSMGEDMRGRGLQHPKLELKPQYYIIS
jgi:hypothetical protein